MARTEAPASSESRRQQQLTTPAATAPLLDSTLSTIKWLTGNVYPAVVAPGAPRLRRHAETPSHFIQHWEPRRLPNNTPEGLREAARRAAVKARVDAILARAGIKGALSKVTS